MEVFLLKHTCICLQNTTFRAPKILLSTPLLLPPLLQQPLWHKKNWQEILKDEFLIITEVLQHKKVWTACRSTTIGVFKGSLQKTKSVLWPRILGRTLLETEFPSFDNRWTVQGLYHRHPSQISFCSLKIQLNHFTMCLIYSCYKGEPLKYSITKIQQYFFL